MCQSDLFFFKSDDLALDAKDRDFNDAVAVDLQNLPGLICIIHNKYHLNICLATAFVASSILHLTAGINAHQKIGLQIRTLTIGLSLIENFLQFRLCTDRHRADLI